MHHGAAVLEPDRETGRHLARRDDAAVVRGDVEDIDGAQLTERPHGLPAVAPEPAPREGRVLGGQEKTSARLRSLT